MLTIHYFRLKAQCITINSFLFYVEFDKIHNEFCQWQMKYFSAHL